MKYLERDCLANGTGQGIKARVRCWIDWSFTQTPRHRRKRKGTLPGFTNQVKTGACPHPAPIDDVREWSQVQLQMRGKNRV